MNAKQLKFYSILESLISAGILNESAVKKHFTSFLNLDYALAADVWDYICSAHESEIAASKELSMLLGSEVLEAFSSKGAPKTLKTVVELAAVRRAVYQYSPAADKGSAFNFLVDVLVANKIDAADEMLKCLIKNDRIKYGATLKAVLERLFIEILKKNPAKKIEMPRKTSSLLLGYISKIKTDERAMLEQRIRETM